MVDFGIAKRVAEPGHTSSTDPFADVLTAHYAAPEQALGKGAGRPADIYAMGMVLYEMIAGKHAFSPATGEVLPRQAALLNHVLTVPKPLGEVALGFDAPGVGALVARMLAKDPDARPGADEVYDVLGAELERYEATHPYARSKLFRREEDEEDSAGKARARRSPRTPRRAPPRL